MKLYFEQGCEEILVNDSHGKMNNIVIEDLHPQAQIISGTVKPYCMV